MSILVLFDIVLLADNASLIQHPLTLCGVVEVIARRAHGDMGLCLFTTLVSACGGDRSASKLITKLRFCGKLSGFLGRFATN